ncbi:hypothetical protein K2173_006832 [Erythroxylum novogranatense]|uniref:CTLH domain-containing protein n=1 Tax=Erythroxylum novogranatense TaxID=1862640 RepID=A0AAV8SXW0_9ROSI|nr:hypothetical protein K2173_006832 [Erythroxylum novogranatense]
MNLGSDCVHPFVALQNCIKANPNAFSKDILEDEEAEKKQQEQPQPVQDGKIIPPLWSRESSSYNKTVAALEEESRIPLHQSKLKLLLQLVMEEKWEECVGTLSAIDHLDGETIKLAIFLLLEQKFLDLLKMVKVNDATRTLREESVPLGVNMTRVSELSSCLTAPPERLISG